MTMRQEQLTKMKSKIILLPLSLLCLKLLIIISCCSTAILSSNAFVHIVKQQPPQHIALNFKKTKATKSSFRTIIRTKTLQLETKQPWSNRCSTSTIGKRVHHQYTSLYGQVDESQTETEVPITRIDVNDHPNLYKIRLPRAPGIEWGTDLSFTFVYVRNIEPSGPADISNIVSTGDQICELSPINDKTGEVMDPPIPLIGAPFDTVMSAFATLDKSVKELEYVFFRGTKEELIQACKESSGADGDTSDNTETDTITVTVMERGKTTPVKTLVAKKGVNVRKLLTDNNINVYQSITRWTNCKGKQLCGTCIVNITNGTQKYTNRKSMDEESTLRENPDTYRLSCITFAYGDITVETFPPISASQWTR